VSSKQPLLNVIIWLVYSSGLEPLTLMKMRLDNVCIDNWFRTAISVQIHQRKHLHSAEDNSYISTRCIDLFGSTRPTLHLYIFENVKLIDNLLVNLKYPGLFNNISVSINGQLVFIAQNCTSCKNMLIRGNALSCCRQRPEKTGAL